MRCYRGAGIDSERAPFRTPLDPRPKQRLAFRRQPVADLEAEREAEILQLAHVALELVARAAETSARASPQALPGRASIARNVARVHAPMRERRSIASRRCTSSASSSAETTPVVGFRTCRRFAVVVEVDDEDALAGAVLRRLQQIAEGREAGAPRQRRRDVVERVS